MAKGELGYHSVDIGRHVGDAPAKRGPAGLAAPTADVGCNHPPAVGKPADLSRPVTPVAAQAVDQYHRFGDRVFQRLAVQIEVDVMDESAIWRFNEWHQNAALKVMEARVFSAAPSGLSRAAPS